MQDLRKAARSLSDLLCSGTSWSQVGLMPALVMSTFHGISRAVGKHLVRSSLTVHGSGQGCDEVRLRC